MARRDGCAKSSGCAAVAIASALAAGCVHAPPPRAAAPGEAVVLEAVSFETPPGEGWRIADAVAPDRRLVELWQVRPDGAWDRRAWVEEHVWKGPLPGSEAFLARARKLLPATDARADVRPAPDEALALDGRFGPLSAAGSVTMEPAPGREDEVVRGTFHVREWISPGPPARFVRAAWVERTPPAGEAAARPSWARLDASLRSPPAPDAERSVPDAEEGGALVLEPGAMLAALRGERLVGGGARVSVVGGTLHPRAGTFAGASLDVSTFAGGNEEWLGLVTTLGVSAWQGRGRLRWGAGVELGLSSLDRLEAERRILGFVLGARAATQLDLLRLRRPGSAVDVFLQLDGGVATPRLYRAGATVGIRFGERRW